MKFVYYLYAGLFPLISLAQEKRGIQFSVKDNWQEVLAMAESSNKYVFVDLYTTWCSPCKLMKRDIFPDKKLGQYFNEHFISVEIQMDSTNNDDVHVRAWYKDARMMLKEYKINAYPTFLFFTPDGELVHKIVGGSVTPEEFVRKAAVALDPNKRYYSLLKEYENGNRDKALIKSLIHAADNANDDALAREVAGKYLLSLKNPYKSKEDLKLLFTYTTRTTDPGFKLMYKKPRKVNLQMGAHAAEAKMINVLLIEQAKELFKKNAAPPGWDIIGEDFNNSFPKIAKEALATLKVYYYKRKLDWPNFEVNVVSYLSSNGKYAHHSTLNEYTWSLFEHSTNKEALSTAAEWSLHSIKAIGEDAARHFYYDTYANLLYKLGRTTEAIEWEQKAVEAAPAASKASYQQTLEKMKNGEKTWN